MLNIVYTVNNNFILTCLLDETWPHTGNREVYPPFPILDLPVSPFFDGCPQKQRAIKDRIKERQSPGAQNSRVFYFSELTEIL